MDDSIASQNLKVKQNLKSEKRILRISFVGSALFLLSECAAAFLTHSQAVLMDCIYDLVDLVMLGPFMILVPKLYKPVTEKWPYGFSQIESLFIIIKCGLLLFLDLQLLTDNVQLIMDGGDVYKRQSRINTAVSTPVLFSLFAESTFPFFNIMSAIIIPFDFAKKFLLF